MVLKIPESGGFQGSTVIQLTNDFTHIIQPFFEVIKHLDNFQLENNGKFAEQ